MEIERRKFFGLLAVTPVMGAAAIVKGAEKPAPLTQPMREEVQVIRDETTGQIVSLLIR